MNNTISRNALICFLLAISLLLFSGGCAVSQQVCVADGLSYCQVRGNFTGRWYDYYERALSCMEGGCYQAALADLQEAISRRGEDQRRARTMGMHFIDYFPHREKGLIHYLTGDYEAARAELEQSLAQHPSEKARFYLDKIRVLEFRQAGRRPGIPRLTLNLPTPDPSELIWTRDDPVLIAGKAVDEKRFVSDVLINDQPVFMESSGPEIAFSKALRLPEGVHEIQVKAINLMGGEIQQALRLRVDRSGPMIAIKRFVPGKTISGSLLDPAGVAGLQINGQAISINKDNQIIFNSDLVSDLAMIVAKDRLGNETRSYLTYDATADKTMSKWMAWAGISPRTAGLLAFSPIARLQTSPLQIRIQGVTNPLTVFSETFQLPVEVHTESELRHLSVNGKATPFHQGRIISFNSFLRLVPGENRVTVMAADAEGRHVEKTVRIIRQIPEAFQLRHRYGLSVHPFDFTETDPERIRFQHAVLKGLIAPQRFQVAVSDDLHRLLDRQGLNTDGAAGQASAHAVLLGVVHETRTGIEAAARMVNIATRETLAVGDVYAPSPNRETLEALGLRLSEKFLRQFPLFAADIIEVSDNQVRIVLSNDGPENKRLPSDWPLLIYRLIKTGKHALGQDARIIGSALMAGAGPENMATAIIDMDDVGQVRPTDRIVAR